MNSTKSDAQSISCAKCGGNLALAQRADRTYWLCCVPCGTMGVELDIIA